MANLIELSPNKTYATQANVVKAVEAFKQLECCRYVIMTTDAGRYYPVFLGEKSIMAGAHFHFCCAN